MPDRSKLHGADGGASGKRNSQASASEKATPDQTPGVEERREIWVCERCGLVPGPYHLEPEPLGHCGRATEFVPASLLAVERERREEVEAHLDELTHSLQAESDANFDELERAEQLLAQAQEREPRNHEGLDGLQHPDCRACEERKRLNLGIMAENRTLKKRVEELENGPSSA